jgi:hypothetical protein
VLLAFDDLTLSAGGFACKAIFSASTQRYDVGIGGVDPPITSEDIVAIYSSPNPDMALFSFMERNNVVFIMSVMEFVVRSLS